MKYSDTKREKQKSGLMTTARNSERKQTFLEETSSKTHQTTTLKGIHKQEQRQNN